MEEAVQSICEVCGGTGWEVVLEENISRARRCSCSRVPAGDRLVKLARIPARFLACEFENYEPQSFSQERAKALLMNYAADFPHLDDEIFREAGLLFTGRSGRGKTHLAVAILKGLLKKGISCIFVDFHELLAEIRNSYDELSQTSELQILRPILNVEVLLLDDIGSQRMTEWMQDTVFHIINLRYAQKKPLIITTNLTMEPLKGSPQASLEDRLGYRVISRLYEMCTVIDVDSETDYRKDVRKAGSDLLRNKKEAKH
jgi:DNA replication protein DnaC